MYPRFRGWPYLFKQTPLLDDIRNSLLLYAFGLVDVLESVHLLGALVLHNANLAGYVNELLWLSDVVNIPFQRHPCLLPGAVQSGRG